MKAAKSDRLTAREAQGNAEVEKIISRMNRQFRKGVVDCVSVYWKYYRPAREKK